MMNERRLHDTARTIGDHRLTEPGCEIWAKTEGPHARTLIGQGLDDVQPRGGVILELTNEGDVRAYRCYDYSPGVPEHLRYPVLTEASIAVFDPPNVATLRRLYRRWCGEVAKRRRTATAEEIDKVHDAWRLAAIVGQRGVR